MVKLQLTGILTLEINKSLSSILLNPIDDLHAIYLIYKKKIHK